MLDSQILVRNGKRSGGDNQMAPTPGLIGVLGDPDAAHAVLTPPEGGLRVLTPGTAAHVVATTCPALVLAELTARTGWPLVRPAGTGAARRAHLAAADASALAQGRGVGIHLTGLDGVPVDPALGPAGDANNLAVMTPGGFVHDATGVRLAGAVEACGQDASYLGAAQRDLLAGAAAMAVEAVSDLLGEGEDGSWRTGRAHPSEGYVRREVRATRKQEQSATSGALQPPSFSDLGTARWAVSTHYLDDDRQAHRQGGPAVEDHDLSVSWWRHGELHRGDGPAWSNDAGAYGFALDGQEDFWVTHGGAQPSAAKMAALVQAGARTAGVVNWFVLPDAIARELIAAGGDARGAALAWQAGVREVATLVEVSCDRLPLSWAIAGT